MKKNEIQLLQYPLDDDWMIEVVREEETDSYRLLNKASGVARVLRTEGKDHNPDEVVEQMIASVKAEMDHIAYDTEMDSRHLVKYASDIWKDCKNENEFIGNVSYMVLGVMVQAYNAIIENRPFLLEDWEAPVAVMKGVHKVGESLISVEHRNGTANAVANNRANPLDCN